MRQTVLFAHQKRRCLAGAKLPKVLKPPGRRMGSSLGFRLVSRMQKAQTPVPTVMEIGLPICEFRTPQRSNHQSMDTLPHLFVASNL